jgi:uridylate kinase
MVKTPSRVLLKLSGEALQGSSQHGIAHEATISWAEGIKKLIEKNIEVAVVLGAGNIFRGQEGESVGMARIPADHMGLLATIINGIALEQALIAIGLTPILMSAINCHPIAEPFHWQRALHHLGQKHVLIFVGGTGSPYFTTDTAAALRASEIGAELLLKATKVDGVYTKDPLKFPDAKRYDEISYTEVLQQKLNVMDATSIALCMSNKIPILVFDMRAKDLFEVIQNQKKGTLVH